ncbi:hypothetical protein LTR27_009159 [Elasticomyces elasticus]|nr:hypothetical protein LTR27_009159 [Elasticomyces elasticus]
MTSALSLNSQVKSYYPVPSEFVVNATYGTDNVYTTLDGVPIASGNFTPTAVVREMVTTTTSTYSMLTTTINDARTSTTPSCSTSDISPSDCSLLYVSYIHSLGLASNATVPRITPAPTNSPQCSAYYYKPWSSCYTRTGQDGGLCSVGGVNVQLFYFPPTTANGNATKSNATMVQSYAPGITFTSPSIYLSFDYLLASSSFPWVYSGCESCGRTGTGWGCTATVEDGGVGNTGTGTTIDGYFLSLAADDVSTLLAEFPGTAPSSAADAVAHGRIHFSYHYQLTAQRLDLHALTRPALTDYYLNPRGAPGCTYDYPTPQCSTLFEGEYRPIISLPAQIISLQDHWKDCVPALEGVYDPPYALTEVSSANGPSSPSISRTTELANPSSNQPMPASSPVPATPLATFIPSVSTSAQPASIAPSYKSNVVSSQEAIALSEPSLYQPTPATSSGVNNAEPSASPKSGLDENLTQAAFHAVDATEVPTSHAAESSADQQSATEQMATNALAVLQSAAQSAYLTDYESDPTVLPASAAAKSDLDERPTQATLDAVDATEVPTSHAADPTVETSEPQSTTNALGVLHSALRSPADHDGEPTALPASTAHSTDTPSTNVDINADDAPTSTLLINDQAFTIHAVSNGVVLNGVTLSTGSMSARPVQTVLNDQRVSIESGVVMIAGTFVSVAQQPVLSSVTPVLTQATTGASIDGSAAPLRNVVGLSKDVDTAIITISGTPHTAVLTSGASIAVIDGSMTLAVGGDGTAIEGQSISFALGGLAIGKSTQAFAAMHTSQLPIDVGTPSTSLDASISANLLAAATTSGQSRSNAKKEASGLSAVATVGLALLVI